MKDYTGKKVFLGIDVHKKTYAVTAISESTVVKKLLYSHLIYNLHYLAASADHKFSFFHSRLVHA